MAIEKVMILGVKRSDETTNRHHFADKTSRIGNYAFPSSTPSSHNTASLVLQTIKSLYSHILHKLSVYPLMFLLPTFSIRSQITRRLHYNQPWRDKILS